MALQIVSPHVGRVRERRVEDRGAQSVADPAAARRSAWRTCPALLVLLQPGRSNTAVLQVAAELAPRWRSHVVGMGVAQIVPGVQGIGALDGTLLQQVHEELQRELIEAEDEFRRALGGRAATLAWRTSLGLTPLVNFATEEARCADLLITAAAPGDRLDFSRHLDAGTLVKQAGRPVLVVPAARTDAPLRHALVAWQDTPESRRAVLDALPLLQLAAQTTVAEIAAPQDAERAQARLDDVCSWLLRHGVQAQTALTLGTGGAGDAIDALVQDSGADLLVAGAFGHSRLREWMMGGMTRDTLLQSTCSVLLSH